MRKDAGNLIFLVINLINTYDEFFYGCFLALLLFRCCLRPYDVTPGMIWSGSDLCCDPAWCNRLFYS